MEVLKREMFVEILQNLVKFNGIVADVRELVMICISCNLIFKFLASLAHDTFQFLAQ